MGAPGGLADRGLEIRNVTVRFGGILALEDVSVTVAPGDVVGIIGPNGAGKTTLFNVICGFVRPTRGAVRFHGDVQERVRTHRLAELGVGRTLQGLGLFPGLSAQQNVVAGATTRARAGFWSSLGGLPRSTHDEAELAARARSTLAALGVTTGLDRLPATLPYGVQKKVALARVLVAEPSILLLDEPGSGLSDAEMSDLGVLIRRLAADGLAIALVEHHMDLVMSVCDRVVVLELGRVIAEGTPDEVRADPAVTAAYLGEEATGPVDHVDDVIDG
ncbi:MAG TPA: ABC transporter ATP-binding protein [Acidimicrobiales bacterium]|nr:ABC transporter ATP-binding protein [Acidimicrobiales bacterium]